MYGTGEGQGTRCPCVDNGITLLKSLNRAFKYPSTNFQESYVPTFNSEYSYIFGISSLERVKVMQVFHTV